MKAKTLFALAALMALAIGSDAQTPVKTAPKPPVKKTMPMRDPKTGRFMKKPTTAKKPTKVHAKTTKPGAMRDPKTGRFVKKKG